MNTNMIWAGIAAAVLVAGCASTSTSPRNAADASKGAKAFALLEPTAGNLANGSVRFMQEGDRVLVIADIHNLPPNSEHGFHLHENGDCSSGDGVSAGGHFNPDGKPHGPPGAPHHDGDMPALKSDANGVAKTAFVLRGISVSAGPHSVVGKALIVHKDPDDYTTQPAGNSGARLACGVVAQR